MAVRRSLWIGRFESEDQVSAGIAANYKFDFACVYAAYQYADNVERFPVEFPIALEILTTPMHSFFCQSISVTQAISLRISSTRDGSPCAPVKSVVCEKELAGRRTFDQTCSAGQ